MNKYLVIGAATAGLALVYLSYRGASKLVDAVPDALEAINPMNNDNIINKGATSLYQMLSGSTGTIGGDFYDGTHGGALDVTSSNNFINKGMEAAWGGILGDPNWTLGGQIYDWTH